MALLDDIATADPITPGGNEPAQGERTFTAPRPAPLPEYVPPFLRGIKPITSKMLQDSWDAKAKKESDNVGQSAGKPGDLLSRIAGIGSSQKLTDVMSDFNKYNPRNPSSPISQIMREGKAYDLTLSGEAPNMDVARNAMKDQSAASISEGPQAKQNAGNTIQDAILSSLGSTVPGPGGLIAKLASVSDIGKVPMNVALQGANTFNILQSVAPDTYEKSLALTEPQSDIGKSVAGFAGGAAKVIPELLLLKKVLDPVTGELPEAQQGAALFGSQALASGVAPVIAGKETPSDVGKEVVSSTLLGAVFPGATSAAKSVAEPLLENASNLVKRTGEAGAEAIAAGSLGAAQTTLEGAINNKDVSTEDQAKAALNLGLFAGISNIAGGTAKASVDHIVNGNKMVEAIIGQESGGNYGATNTTYSKSRGRDITAYGKYQVLDENIPAWTEKYLGKRMTPDQFLADKSAQDVVGQSHIKDLYQKNLERYGNERRAAKETALDWYGRGEPTSGPSPKTYANQVVHRFDKATGESVESSQPTANSEQPKPDTRPPASEAAPETPLAPIEPAPEEIKAQIDNAAHQAATSPTNDLPEPTPLQQQSGNYKKGHVDIAGFDISVENPSGSIRKGITPDGTPWETEMKDHYGYIKGSTGADGDHLDVFIGPDPASEKVFVIDQRNAEDENKPFDEHKVILGATSINDALTIYKRNFSDDASPRIGAITETAPNDLKDWIKSGNTREPFSESDVAKRLLLPEPIQRAYGKTPAKEPITEGEENAITTGPEPSRDLSEYQDRATSGQTTQPGSGDSAAHSEPAKETEIPQANSEGERPVQSNNQPVPEEIPDEIKKQPLAVHSLGDETAIELTGKTPLKARYAVVEADDLQASHNEETFSPNPNYPDRTQTRDYTGTKEEQAKVIGNAENFKPQYIVTDDPSPVNGPPIVDGNGNVAGGNGRTMTIKRVYNNNPEAAQSFKDLQIKKASNFGIDPEAVRALDKPVIIRQLNDTDLRGSGGSKLVDDLNDVPTQQSDALTQGVTTGRRMSPGDVTEIASALQDGNSIRDALSTKASTDRIRNVLRNNGTITRVNAPRYLKPDGTFTPEGVNLIEGAMMGRVIDDVGTAKIIQSLGGNYAKKITEALHPLSVIEGAPKEWSIKGRLDKVMRYIAARGDMPDADFRAQPAMFEGQDIKLDNGDRAILNALDDSKIKTFKNFANDYAERIGGDIFNPNTTPTDALNETVKVFGGGRGAGTLSSEIFPGAGMVAKSFEATYEQDIKPAIVGAAKGMIEAAHDIQKIFAPATRGDAAKETKLIMRDKMSSLARSREIAETSMEQSRKALEKLSQAAKYDFIDRNERGLEQATPELEAISKSVAPIFESRIEKVHEIAPGKLKDLIDNYFPHIWEDPKKATQVFAQIYAKRPFEGPKAFLKQRVHEYFSDGIAAGLKPVSDNPIDLVLLKAHEIDRFIMAHETLNEMKDRGILKYVSVSERAPDGYVKIDDKVSTVYGNPEIPIPKGYEPSQISAKIDGDQIAEEKNTVNAGGMVIRGNYYAPEEAARIVNNYLSPGLRQKSGLFRAYLGLGNVLNQAQLGLSAFHAGFVVVDSITSGLALGIYKGVKGQILEGAKTATSAIATPFTNLITGSKVLKEWSRPGSQGEEIGLITDALQSGGGRARMDAFYHTTISDNMVKAFKNANIIGAAMRLPFAAVETLAKPIMEHLVPRMKLGAFANMARFELERNQAELDNMSPSDRTQRVREIMGNAWDSVDNRLGQLVYDNLFWNKATKDLAMASVRSVGWNIGTFRELGGGLIDYGKAIKQIATGHYKDAEFTHRMSYVVAAPIVAGFIGGAIHYMMTGEQPQDLKDYFFPKTGGKDEQGNDARVSLPSYMKDVFAYQNDIHDAIALRQPVTALRTVLNKVHPEIGMISEMLQNKDYYGTKIVGDNDNFLEKFAEHSAQAFIPFGVRGIMRNIENEGMSAKSTLPFIGITPAPKTLNQSDASKLIQSYTDQSKTVSGYESSARSEAKYKAIAAFRAGKNDEANRIMREGIRKGILTSKVATSGPHEGEHTTDDIGEIFKQSKYSHEEWTIKEHLTHEQALNVYEKATPEQRRKWQPLIYDKFYRTKKTKDGDEETVLAKSVDNLPDSDKRSLMEKYRQTMKLPRK